MNPKPRPKPNTAAISDSEDTRKRKITKLFTYGTFCLGISTILIGLVALILDPRIENMKSSLDRIMFQYEEYKRNEMFATVEVANFYQVKLIKTDSIDIQKMIINDALKAIDKHKVNSAIATSPTYPEQNTLDYWKTLPIGKLDTIIVKNALIQFGKINEIGSKLENTEKTKRGIYVFLMILQIVGLVLNQRAIILRVKYRI